ncbi:uncharacterized protein VNE69_04063 [Vairimorpha necatrix]|uniref:Uncharacterized protein n=1 Tax=Vairimorpha necatrix TaxID=6039 RepID=A0AAX4JBC0_9MICR
MESSKKIVKYISDSLSNMSTMIFNSSSDDIELNDIKTYKDDTSLKDDTSKTNDTSLEWSKDNVCDETIIIKKSDYDRVLSELSFSRMQNNNYKIKEREYTRLRNDYDKTLTLLTNSQHINNNIIEDNDLDRLRSTELRLKSHIKALKKDLFESEQRSDAFKCIAQSEMENMREEIRRLERQNNQEREEKEKLESKIKRLEDILQNRCEENIELLEYCKYLMK